MTRFILALPLALLPAALLADAPVVEKVEARRGTDGWTFAVTVRHGDTGWDHYADGWSIFDAKGAEIGHRALLHPHETEQPFTRSLRGVAIPADLSTVFVKAHDSVHGWGAPFEVTLTP
ncbi:hypothetical protein [Jannaschia sp. 2305UL9-9]|uniref:hypothetical protein n=1 Tax=Jannaschia sp. 2305UL9-9 TaxID=3121638 RepID=UPI0035283ABC